MAGVSITAVSGRVLRVVFPMGSSGRTITLNGGDTRAIETDVAYVSGLSPATSYGVTTDYSLEGETYPEPGGVTTLADDAPVANDCGGCMLADAVVQVWGPNRERNITHGLNDATWVPAGDFMALVEEHTAEHHVLMGGDMAATKSCTVYTDDATAGGLMTGDLLVVAGKVWRVTSIPVQPMAGGHWEIEGEWESHPPVEVLPWI